MPATLPAAPHRRQPAATACRRGHLTAGLAGSAGHARSATLPEERDQHLVLGVNELTPQEWDDSFGRVYRPHIDASVFGYGAENNYRIRWKTATSNKCPWYVWEFPTFMVSLNYATHRHDETMLLNRRPQASPRSSPAA
ncbi:MAG: hypothetical protein IPG68_11975 [Micrococcales bacterium]|nr:hypothetical protein [Micrococcales bacterium]